MDSSEVFGVQENLEKLNLIEANIRFLQAEFVSVQWKIFDAALLQVAHPFIVFILMYERKDNFMFATSFVPPSSISKSIYILTRGIQNPAFTLHYKQI